MGDSTVHGSREAGTPRPPTEDATMERSSRTRGWCLATAWSVGQATHRGHTASDSADVDCPEQAKPQRQPADQQVPGMGTAAGYSWRTRVDESPSSQVQVTVGRSVYLPQVWTDVCCPVLTVTASHGPTPPALHLPPPTPDPDPDPSLSAQFAQNITQLESHSVWPPPFHRDVIDS